MQHAVCGTQALTAHCTMQHLGPARPAASSSWQTTAAATAVVIVGAAAVTAAGSTVVTQTNCAGAAAAAADAAVAITAAVSIILTALPLRPRLYAAVYHSHKPLTGCALKACVWGHMRGHMRGHMWVHNKYTVVGAAPAMGLPSVLS